MQKAMQWKRLPQQNRGILNYEKIKDAEESLVQAHHSQTEMLTQEAQGNHVEVTLLTVHSQDHLMTSIAFTDLAKEIIDLYRRLNA